MDRRAPVDVLVFGAGAIGLYLGGRLALAGQRVHFVARQHVVDALSAHGLAVTDLSGSTQHLQSGQFGCSVGLVDAPAAELVLLTVKGTATESAACDLATWCAPGTHLISFQNGVDNPARIARAAPALDAIAGMVPFNVVQVSAHHVRQTSSGRLAAAYCALTQRWVDRFAVAQLPLDLHADMLAVQWGKLLLNLNNPLNALAGIPLREELEDRAWRCLLADLQDEALRVMRAAGIQPARVTPLPTRWLPAMLRLPTLVFRVVARRMLTIDPKARSSMYDDRVRGRLTEIDDLCGAVVRLAAANGQRAPLNAAMVKLIHLAPQGQFYSAETVAQQLRVAA